MRIRMNSKFALIGTLVMYPILYYAWVKQIKNSWIENDILHNHQDILYPEENRYKASSAPYSLESQLEEALIFTPKDIKKKQVI